VVGKPETGMPAAMADTALAMMELKMSTELAFAADCLR